MKILSDFITNSSSSSFIIAKNNRCTLDEIINVLSTKKKDIEYTLNMYDMDYDDDTITLFINELASRLYKKDNTLQLCDWGVSSRYYDNESDEFSAFMYDFGHGLETENFKVVSCE